MLTEQTTISTITILEDGQIQIRRTRRVFDGVELLAEQYHRTVLAPGDDVSGHPLRLRAVCAAVWTPAVVAAYEAAKAARQTQIG